MRSASTHTDPATGNRYLRLQAAAGTLAIEDDAQGLVLPHHCADALSTDSGPPHGPSH